ncbi:MAG: hypothetical protein L0Y37_05230 [Bacteroidales bacterium]|nr:hypothetical protein [Bacteroidales bacterium]
MIYSRYIYNLGTPEGGTGAFAFNWDSRLTGYSSKIDFTHLLIDKHKLRYGASIIFHEFFPGEVKGIGSTTGDTYFKLEPRLAFTWLLDGNSSVKGSYGHMTQYIYS